MSPVSDEVTLVFPAPKYPVGAQIVALIDHHLRYVQVEEIHLDTQIVIGASGVTLSRPPRWEYVVRPTSDSAAIDRPILIAERTILRELTPDESLK